MKSTESELIFPRLEEDAGQKQEGKKAGNTRVTGKEQYYTPKATAIEILFNLDGMIPDLKDRSLLEPAGGTGSFIHAAKEIGIHKIVSYDIEPHHPEVKKGNFLEQEISLANAITVTNPPFGRNNSLSIPFFNHAAKYSEYIVFIVPRSWRKWSVQNKLDRRFFLIRDEDLEIGYEDVNGINGYKNNHLRTCIQYWKKSDEKLRPIYEVKDMGIVSKCSFQDADVSLTIFGYGCGTVKTEFPRKPNTTQMFLKLHHPQALDALQSVDFSKFFRHTAYTEALSLMEINYLLNEYVFGETFLEDEDDLYLFDL